MDIPGPTGTLIPPNVLRLLSSNSTVSNALFASIVRGPVVDGPEASIRECIISSYLTDAVASQHLTNPQHPWTCSLDGLLLYKGLIYIPESPPLRMDIMREHHDAPLAGHHGIAKTIELITGEITGFLAFMPLPRATSTPVNCASKERLLGTDATAS